VWGLDSSGHANSWSGWKTADQAAAAGWETTFNADLNGDGITGEPAKDANGDGLVDGASNYQIFDDGKAVALRGGTLSDATSTSWDVTSVVKSGNGYEALLEGQGVKADAYYVWGLDSSGHATAWSGWKTADQAAAAGWEAKFNADLNGDGALAEVKEQNLF